MCCLVSYKMILRFGDERTQQIFKGLAVKRLGVDDHLSLGRQRRYVQLVDYH